MLYDLKMLLGFIDTYFEFYSNNPVPDSKIQIEFNSWLSVNYMLGFISDDDFSFASGYAAKKFMNRREM